MKNLLHRLQAMTRLKQFTLLATAVVLVAMLAIASAYGVVTTFHGVPGQTAQQDGPPVILIGTAEASETVDYLCDGADDHVQFQAALDALPAGGGEIRFLAGVYVFGATPARAINNVKVEGIGKASTVTYNGVSPVFSAGAQDGWAFEWPRTQA